MFIGVMSGTSMDAIDVCVVDFNASVAKLIAANTHAWPDALRERVRAFADGASISASALASLDVEVGHLFADAIVDLLHHAALKPARITAIGCHGQTVAHAPEASPPATLQLGDANTIAERTGITTINDFRRRDVAAGGQGAPLAPAFHAAALRRTDEERVVLNLGGIANITLLPSADDQPILGFDTGPANCLMDDWAARHIDQPFDRDGRWAASGTVDTTLLDHLLADPYFAELPPKSTGTQYFSSAWLDARLGAARNVHPADVQATLLALSRDSIVAAIHQLAPSSQRVLVCGGGARNTQLIQELADALRYPVESTATQGIDPDYMEAMAFAWLAQRTLASLPGNIAAVTGAEGERILGAIHPGH